MPWTALLTCCYMDNFATMWQYQRDPDGARVWSDNLGSKPLAVHAVADIGGSAAGAFHYCCAVDVSLAVHEVPRARSSPCTRSMRQEGGGGSSPALALLSLSP